MPRSSGSHAPDGMQTKSKTGPSYGLAWQIAAITLVRLLMNTARRFPYTFAPVLSRSLGVPFTAITSLIAINQATALLGLLFGPLADRFGYRRMIQSGLAIMTLGMLLAGWVPHYGCVLVALLSAGLGKILCDPAMQAYVSEQVPFQRRGLVMGIMETSWAGSTLIGVPLIGVLIATHDWQSPFIVLGMLGLLCWLVMVTMSGTGATPNTRRISLPKTSGYQGLIAAWRLMLTHRPALGAMGFAFLMNAGNDTLFVIYGDWLEKSFGLGVVALGLGTGIIGLAELTGEFLTSAIGDRLGLKRLVCISVLLAIAIYLLLPLLNPHIAVALGALFGLFLCFEMAIVAYLSLCTELVPGVRATMMATVHASAGLGRVTGTLIGGHLWHHTGMMAIGGTSAVLSCLALMALLWGLKGWRHQAR